MVSQRGLYKSLKCMIDWTEQQQDRSDYMLPKGYFSPKSWIKEFCTIKFGLPRQSGHTTFAKKLIGEIGTRVLYIAPNQQILKHANLPPINRMTVEGVANKQHLGRRFQMVIVDCASLLSQRDLETLYDAFAPMAHAEPCFVMLLLE